MAHFLPLTADFCSAMVILLSCSQPEAASLSFWKLQWLMSGALLALVMLSVMLVAKVLLQRGKLAVRAMEVEILLSGQSLFH
jgi:hypothetical protein